MSQKHPAPKATAAQFGAVHSGILRESMMTTTPRRGLTFVYPLLVFLTALFEVEGSWPQNPCPTGFGLVTPGCVEAQKEVCAQAGVLPSFQQVFTDAWHLRAAQFRQQCNASMRNCTRGSNKWECCNVELEWKSYVEDLKRFMANATRIGGVDICMLNMAVQLEGRPDLQVTNYSHVMPVAVAQACGESDRQVIVAQLAQRMATSNVSILLPQPKPKILSGTIWWDYSISSIISGFNRGCLAPERAKY